jgi:hypothetical protein
MNKSCLFAAAIVTAGGLAAAASASTVSPRSFVTRGPSGVSCELGLDRHSSRPVNYVACLAYRLGSPDRTAVSVRMSGTGALTVCHGRPCIGHSPDHDPALKAGHSIRLGLFRCTALRRGGLERVGR